MQMFLDLFSNVLNFTWQQGLMILIGAGLIYSGITDLIAIAFIARQLRDRSEGPTLR